MLRIWFNRTYATNVHTIRLLRENPEGRAVFVVGTHSDPTSPVLGACDVTEPEPDGSVVGDAYVAWALDLCRRHAVDVFVPRLHLEVVTAARDAFTAAGVALVAGPAGPAALLEDKAAAYADALAAGLAVPPYRVVGTGDELRRGFAELVEDVGDDLVLKPVTGVGAEGYRRLLSARPGISQVIGDLEPFMNVDDVASAVDAHLDAGGAPRPFLLLPFLTGPEVSVDCLADDDGHLLAAVPRTKLSRLRMLVDDPAAVDVARTIVGRHRLSSLSNTQVRYWRHPRLDPEPLPYFLETNARISGGLYQTALSGLNLPWAAVRLALGEHVVLPAPELGISYTTVSSVVPLSNRPPGG